jgi:large subunit ribosomal protein L21
MYAIIHTGGKQYKVQEGDVLRIEKLPGAEGQAVHFKRVLFYSNESDVKVGTPMIDGAQVDAEIIQNGRGKKILVFKKKRRKGFAKKQGHRQDFTEVKILKIKV